MITVTRNLFMLICLLLVQQSVLAEKNLFPMTPPGYFVNLGLHRLYIDCRGYKTPTVLIDVGLGDSSANWLPIAESLREHARVCVYDRAGYGWSDSGPGSRTTAQIAHELHALLELDGLPGPYILVGHSFGGFTAQYFASRYPEQTAGVVLIESSHPDQVERLAPLDQAGSRHELVVTRNKPPQDHLTDMQKKWYFLNSSRKAVFAQMDELKHFSESAAQVKEQLQTNGRFPDIPLAVLSRGKKQLPVLQNESLEEAWIDMQKDLAGLSSKSWHIFIKESGHSVYADAPGIIVENIVKVITQARLERTGKTGEETLSQR